MSKQFIPLHSFKRRKFEDTECGVESRSFGSTLVELITETENDNIECGVEQLVARRAHNPKVARSSRVPATKKLGVESIKLGVSPN